MYYITSHILYHTRFVPAVGILSATSLIITLLVWSFYKIIVDKNVAAKNIQQAMSYMNKHIHHTLK